MPYVSSLCNMLKGALKTIFSPPPAKDFGAWQIELTTRCPLRCKMCVREQCPNRPRQEMSLDDFRKILPYLKNVESVVLEGWGESLFHPNLPEIIRLAKKEGPQVGFVTSVMGISESAIEEILQAGVDFIGFSIAGAAPKTHNAIRVNSDLEKLLQGIRTFQSAKARRQQEKPNFHIVYLLLKDNIAEAPLVPPLAKSLGITHVFLIQLAQVSNTWQDQQKCFSRNALKEYEDILKEVEAKARELKISLRCPPTAAQDVSVCSENPLRNLYISVKGNVSPCVYLNPPVDSPFIRIYDGKECPTEKVKFGNIFEEPFAKIWHGEEYEAFRNCFTAREKKFKEVYDAFLKGERSQNLDRPFPDPPLPCQTCHKMWGM